MYVDLGFPSLSHKKPKKTLRKNPRFPRNPSTCEQNKNKKVLLRERKRHTARCVASTRYAALSNPDLVIGGGTPFRPGGGYPGYPPPSRPGRGVPHPDLVRGYPIQTWSGEGVLRVAPTPSRPGQGDTSGIPLPSRPDWGVPRVSPTIQTWSGEYPRYLLHHPDLTWGTPHPDLGWGTPWPEMEYPPYLDLRWSTPPPSLEMGYPSYLDLGWGTPTQTWDGIPPYLDLKWGTPTQTWDGVPPSPPPTSVDRLKI